MRKITLGSSWVILRDMTQFDTATATQLPKSGLTLTGFLHTSKTGASGTAIGGLVVTLSEASGVPGTYYGILGASSLLTALTTILGTQQKVTIYERVVGADYPDYEPLELWASRQAGE